MRAGHGAHGILEATGRSSVTVAPAPRSVPPVVNDNCATSCRLADRRGAARRSAQFQEGIAIRMRDRELKRVERRGHVQVRNIDRTACRVQQRLDRPLLRSIECDRAMAQRPTVVHHAQRPDHIRSNTSRRNKSKRPTFAPVQSGARCRGVTGTRRNSGAAARAIEPVRCL